MVRTFGHEILRCSVIVILSKIRVWQPIMIGASYHAQSAHLMAGIIYRYKFFMVLY